MEAQAGYIKGGVQINMEDRDEWGEKTKTEREREREKTN